MCLTCMHIPHMMRTIAKGSAMWRLTIIKRGSQFTRTGTYDVMYGTWQHYVSQADTIITWLTKDRRT